MASSSERSRKDARSCSSRRVPQVLRETLGDEATGALVDMFDSAGREWRGDVLTVERFERRLTAEASQIRIEMGQMGVKLREEMAHMEARIRQDMGKMGADLRVEIHAECSRTRVEIVRWSFLFWIGQVAVMAGLLAFMLRVGGR